MKQHGTAKNTHSRAKLQRNPKTKDTAPVREGKTKDSEKIKVIASQLQELLTSMEGGTQSSMGEGTANSREKAGTSEGAVDTGLDSIESLIKRISTGFCKKNKAQRVERSGDVAAGSGVFPTDGSKHQQRRKLGKKVFTPFTYDETNETFPRYHVMKFGEECKRSVNPYAVIERVAEVTGEKPTSVTGNNRTSLTIEVGSKQQARKLQDIESVEEFQCTVMLHPRFNYSRGIIYIHEFDVDNTEA